MATKKVLEKANLKLSNIDFFEINEAFSVVPIVYMKTLNIADEKVNAFGGARTRQSCFGSSSYHDDVTSLGMPIRF